MVGTRWLGRWLAVGAIACCAGTADPEGAMRGMAVRTTQAGASSAAQGALVARPGHPQLPAPRAGFSRLGLRPARDAWLYVPPGRTAEQTGPLVVVLHGAGGEGRGAIQIFKELADRQNLLLLAPESEGPSWDLIVGELGPDLAMTDEALAWVFARFAVDPARVVVSGFSDGASYALSIGLANGALFTHVVAFSPGFATPARRQGAPRVFISHGLHDRVLPIDVCSRPIVGRLRRLGYEVTYVEFDGAHAVPPDVVVRAAAWWNEGVSRGLR
jgi:phospholipase/carboxylesterase